MIFELITTRGRQCMHHIMFRPQADDRNLAIRHTTVTHPLRSDTLTFIDCIHRQLPLCRPLRILLKQ